MLPAYAALAPANTGEVDAAKELRAIRFLAEAALLPKPLRLGSPGAEGVRKLRAAGYTAEALVAAGFTPGELFGGGLPKEPKAITLLKEEGFTLKEMWDSRLNIRHLLSGSYGSWAKTARSVTIFELKRAQVSYTEVEWAGHGITGCSLFDNDSARQLYGDFSGSTCWAHWDGNEELICTYHTTPETSKYGKPPFKLTVR
jgi:hypothetical protein